MSALPNSVALEVIPTDGDVNSAPHRNNYSSLQTAANATAAILAGGAAGMVLGVTASDAAPVFPPGYEVGYTQITADVPIASTTEAAGTTIISPGALTFDGSAVICEMFSPRVLVDTVGPGDSVVVSLFEGATQIGRLVVVSVSVAGTPAGVPVIGRLRFMPSGGAHTYTVTAYSTSVTGTPTVQAGAGGTGSLVPAYIRFTKV